MMQIGNLTLKNNVMLAPMAGITNLPFRMLLRDFGCALAFTEMISVDGLVRESEKSFQYLRSSPMDEPLGVQLFGAEPENLAEGAKIAAHYGADLIDINMGCPVRKVVRTGAGSALLKNPLQIARIVKKVRKATCLPLTVKIRSGWSPAKVNAVEIGRIVEDCGADGLIVHARVADQGFGGKADWEVVKAVKEAIKIPVIGNGDIRSGDDASRMVTTTGCDGVMIGRGALGNPWLLGEILSGLNGGNALSAPSPADREAVVERHLAMETEHFGELRGSRNFRKHLLWYTKGLPGGANFRNLAGAQEGKDSLLRELRLFLRLSSEAGKDAA